MAPHARRCASYTTARYFGHGDGPKGATVGAGTHRRGAERRSWPAAGAACVRTQRVRAARRSPTQRAPHRRTGARGSIANAAPLQWQIFFPSVNLADPLTQPAHFPPHPPARATRPSRRPLASPNRCVRLRPPPLCTTVVCLFPPPPALRPKMILRHLSDYGGVPARSEPSAASSRKTPSCLSSLPAHHARSLSFLSFLNLSNRSHLGTRTRAMAPLVSHNRMRNCFRLTCVFDAL